jgi:hypothetical protein
MHLASPTSEGAPMAVTVAMVKKRSSPTCDSTQVIPADDLTPYFQHSTITVHWRASAARSALALSLAKKPEPVL